LLSIIRGGGWAAPEPMKKGGKKGKRKVCAKDGCGALIDDSKRCSRCCLVFYCSRECQVSDWKVHKPRCNAAVADKAAQDARAENRSSMRAATKGAGTGAGAGAGEGEEGAEGDDATATTDDSVDTRCPVCLDVLVDPLSPCPVIKHRCCRVCVEEMRKHGLPTCPLC
jgi:hypothetical protein